MTAPVTQPTRLLSLDVMRGATIIAMILVNNPGSWGALYWPLGHADWHGWTPTDLIFPFFLFMVGVAMAYSFAKYTGAQEGPTAAVWARIFRRVALLILLGLLLSASGQLFELLLGKRTWLDFSTLRWPGVLQRIGLAYFGASLIVLLWRPRWQLVAAIVLLLGYTLLLVNLPTDVVAAERLSPESNVVRAVDLAVIGPNHMWTGSTSRPTDPEGLLSTLPALVTVLFGYGTGRWLKTKPTSELPLLLTGLLIAGIGIGWSRLAYPGLGMPINKALWTPSFVLLSGGLGMTTLAICLLLFDRIGSNSPSVKRCATLFQIVGVNAIFVFVASGLVARFLTVLEIGGQTAKNWIYQNVIVNPLTSIGLVDPKLASAAYAAAFVTCWWLVLWAMWKRGWTIRV